MTVSVDVKFSVAESVEVICTSVDVEFSNTVEVALIWSDVVELNCVLVAVLLCESKEVVEFCCSETVEVVSWVEVACSLVVDFEVWSLVVGADELE